MENVFPPKNSEFAYILENPVMHENTRIQFPSYVVTPSTVLLLLTFELLEVKMVEKNHVISNNSTQYFGSLFSTFQFSNDGLLLVSAQGEGKIM